jgi:hypothetical protein
MKQSNSLVRGLIVIQADKIRGAASWQRGSNKARSFFGLRLIFSRFVNKLSAL